MVMGSTSIHEDVFKEIVRLALEDIEGIYSYESKNPLAPFFGEKNIKPVITVKWPDRQDEETRDQIAFEIRIAVLYGAEIPKVVSGIRRETTEQVTKFTGYEVTAVDVYITRLIRFEKEKGEEGEGSGAGDLERGAGAAGAGGETGAAAAAGASAAGAEDPASVGGDGAQ
ncbi:MAG: Asp23/Gls24 family envelope stress response protein [Peptococcaceae bacterium]|jgi:uncharacterized alkaline shock family protein YloU|nr:Asp23/Gls24 family envelope stress response protein [Peptococcaceae bacterium]